MTPAVGVCPTGGSRASKRDQVPGEAIARQVGIVLQLELVQHAAAIGTDGLDRKVHELRGLAHFRDTPRDSLRDLAQAVINDALRDAGLEPGELRVGSFWTRTGKRKVPGVGNSRATPRELARWLLRLEQGRLVDAWSSLEMKRYLYMTKRRYRYVFAPELAKAAVYFKSGSLYRCRPEEGFACGKYMGNVENAMNSVAIIESPAMPAAGQRRYIVALTSDVRKVNSAWDHSRLGAAVEEAVRSRRSVVVRDAGSAAEVRSSGQSE